MVSLGCITACKSVWDEVVKSGLPAQEMLWFLSAVLGTEAQLSPGRRSLMSLFNKVTVVLHMGRILHLLTCQCNSLDWSTARRDPWGAVNACGDLSVPSKSQTRGDPARERSSQVYVLVGQLLCWFIPLWDERE